MNKYGDAFISYERADSQAFAFKLYQHLSLMQNACACLGDDLKLYQHLGAQRLCNKIST